MQATHPKRYEWARTWISASERIPNHFGVDVLVFVFDNTDPEVKWEAIGTFEQGEGWDVNHYDRKDVTVTHWMPLPQRPQ
jgi:hypothetical protein